MFSVMAICARKCLHPRLFKQRAPSSRVAARKGNGVPRRRAFFAAYDSHASGLARRAFGQRAYIAGASFAGNLALNSHRTAISRHSAGAASLLRATLTYVITRICDHRRPSAAALPFLGVSQTTRTLN